MKHIIHIRTWLLAAGCLFIIAAGMSSCKKYLAIDPPKTQIISGTIFNDDATAKAALMGIYISMTRSSLQFTSSYTTLYPAMSADELYSFLGDSQADEFRNNRIGNGNPVVLTIWDEAYKYIYTSNAVIEGLKASEGVTAASVNTLTGEALFIRAFSHFYLTNMFGDIPLTLTTDYRKNAVQPRNRQDSVYMQIISDLEQAKTLLSDAYPTPEKARPNRAAAAALLARVYLYTGNYQKAADAASSVIDPGNYTPLPDATLAFKNTSRETIWQLPPSADDHNTWEGDVLLPSSTGTPSYIVNKPLADAFETGDKRKAAWLGMLTYQGDNYYYPYKYKKKAFDGGLDEYYIVLRLAEQYLIRAEARAHLNDISGARDDLNAVRSRAGLNSTSATTQSALLTAVEQERRVELFCEWGHRWFDLKRTGRADILLPPLKPGWTADAKLYPVPQTERLANPFLSQNKGYE